MAFVIKSKAVEKLPVYDEDGNVLLELSVDVSDANVGKLSGLAIQFAKEANECAQLVGCADAAKVTETYERFADAAAKFVAAACGEDGLNAVLQLANAEEPSQAAMVLGQAVSEITPLMSTRLNAVTDAYKTKYLQGIE